MVELEDFHEDILRKAMHGLGIGKSEMASLIKVDQSQIENVLVGGVNEIIIAGMAEILGLSVPRMISSARKDWSPAPVEIQGMKRFNTPFGSMCVNSYLIWDSAIMKAWIFDTGTDAKPILDFLEIEKLSLDAIFLTHTHGDHIACLEEIRQKTLNPPVFVHELESISGAESIKEGFKQELGLLNLQALHTHGHSIGGTTYFVNGLANPLAIVGDALFAGSMGGGMVSYQDALLTNRDKIMTLSDETIVCPGHGPVTTIEGEKRYNPFFPEFIDT